MKKGCLYLRKNWAGNSDIIIILDNVSLMGKTSPADVSVIGWYGLTHKSIGVQSRCYKKNLLAPVSRFKRFQTDL